MRHAQEGACRPSVAGRRISFQKRLRHSCNPGKFHGVRVGYEFCRSTRGHCRVRNLAPNPPSSLRICGGAVAVATLVRYALGLMFGPLPPFVVFLAAIILVALLAGFGPGTLATLLSAASVASFFWPSLSVFGSSRPREIVGLLLFCGIGTGISGLGRL
jgi:K+-sensing histidine kinase KdpD